MSHNIASYKSFIDAKKNNFLKDEFNDFKHCSCLKGGKIYYLCIYRGGLLGGDPGQTAPPGGAQGIMPQQAGSVSSVPANLAGMDLAQQLQLIVRGELRRMMEVRSLL